MWGSLRLTPIIQTANAIGSLALYPHCWEGKLSAVRVRLGFLCDTGVFNLEVHIGTKPASDIHDKSDSCQQAPAIQCSTMIMHETWIWWHCLLALLHWVWLMGGDFEFWNFLLERMRVVTINCEFSLPRLSYNSQIYYGSWERISFKYSTSDSFVSKTALSGWSQGGFVSWRWLEAINLVSPKPLTTAIHGHDRRFRTHTGRA